MPAWHQLGPEHQKSLRLAVHYVNLSARGYIDSRLFQIVQAMELLAGTWVTTPPLAGNIVALQSLLQAARKQWHEKHPGADESGLWGSRVSALFEWPKLRASILKLSGMFGVDLERHEVDLDLFKEARDSVAHTGVLPEAASGRAAGLLASGQYCLQLLLLRMLNYTGLVHGASDGWETTLKMDEAIRTKRS